MKVKTVKRYHCDFCKKSNCSASSMSKHERHCTMNPNRECRMCKLAGELQAEMPTLLNILPDPAKFPGDAYGGWPGLDEAVSKALPELRDATNNCPACILAALRQKGICVAVVSDFNFRNECEAVWTAFNDEQARLCYGNPTGY